MFTGELTVDVSSAVVTVAITAGNAVTVKLNVLITPDCAGVLWSVTVTLYAVAEEDTVAVPVMAPFAELNDRPEGNAGLTAYVKVP